MREGKRGIWPWARTLYPPQVRPAFLLARTHFILRKKDLSISYSGKGERQKWSEPQAPLALRGPLRDRGGQAGPGAVYFTLHEVRVVRLVRRQHRRHLVVVGGVDVLVNAVAGQLYL